MIGIGVSMLALGLATANPAFWIPGLVFTVIGSSGRMGRRRRM